MTCPDPIMVASMIGGLRSFWKARTVGISIAVACWRAGVGFWAQSLSGGSVLGKCPPRRYRLMVTESHSARVSVTSQWIASAMLGLLTVGRNSRAYADDIAPPAVDATDAAEPKPKPLWEAGIGVIVGGVADYPGSNQYRVRGLPIPYLIYRGDLFRSDTNGPRVLKSSGIVEWELSGGGNLSSNSTGGARAGMPGLDYLLEVGPKARIVLSKPTDTSRLLVEAPLRAAVSTNFSSRLNARGAIFAPDLSYEDQSIFGSLWSGRASIGAQWATAGLQRFYYQVDPEYARAGRPAYDARAGYLGATFEFTAFRQLTPTFVIFVALDADNYDGAVNVASPLLRAHNDLEAAIGFAWSIKRSEQQANATR